MAQEDFLKIILEAKLDDESLQNIKNKLEKLKFSVNEIKIKIVEDGNFAKIVDNLTKNLESLNRNLSELTGNQVKQLKNIGDQARKNAEQIKQGKKQEQNDNDKIRQQEENLIKTRTKYNDVGKAVQETKTYKDDGNKNKTRTVTTDLETNEKISDVINTENEKIRKNQDKREQLIKEYQKLRKQYMAELNKMEKAGASKGATDPLRANLSENFRQKEIFGTEKNPQEDYEKNYKQALAETNKVMAKSIEYQKNLNKIRSSQKDMVERKDALKDQGYDVEGINKLMQSQLQANKSTKELNEGISQINNELSKMESKSKTFNKLEEQARKLGITIDKSFKGMGRDTDLTEFQTKIANVQSQINAKKQQANETTRVEIQQMERLLSQLNQEFQERQRIAQEETRLQQHRNKIGGDKIDNAEFGADRVNQVFNESGLRRQDEARELAKAWLEANTQARNLDTATARLSRTLDGLGNETLNVTYNYHDANGAMQSQTVAIDQLTNSMYNLGQQSHQTQQQTSGIQSAFEHLGDSLRRVATYIATFGLAYQVWEQVQQSFRIIYEVDEAMTNLAKVTTATTAEFEAFRLEASQIGQALGATTVEVTKAVTEFQKLGYTFEQAKGLGEISLVYANVGDMGIEQANESMISALKGFGVANQDVVTESERYLDIFNEVGNRFAVSSAGIGEALKRSSASLMEAGNDVEHSVAMITAANAVIQDEKKVGTALKTISMRLRGMDEETGKVTKSVPQVANQFRAAGVEIMATADTFKSTYEIMDELSKNWQNLSDTQRAAMVETIAGKHHGTVVSAMLNNWTDATNSLEVAQNSAGSSSREFAKYQESLVFRVDRLKASYEEFWLTFWDDDRIKTAIDGLNAVLNGLTGLIKNFGSLSVSALGLVPILMLMVKPLRNTFAVSAVDMQRWASATSVATTNMTQMKRATEMATVAVKALGKAMLIGLAISAVIWGLTKAYDALTGSHKKYLDSLTEEYQAQEQLIGQLEQVDLTRFAVLEDKKNAGTIDNTELQEYVRLQEQLKSSGQDVISHYDEQGNAVLLSADALIQLNKERREELTLIREKKVEEEKKAALGESGIRGKFFNAPIDRAILDVVGLDTDVGKFDEAVAKAEDTRNKLNKIKTEIDSIDLVKEVISNSDLASMRTNNQAFQTEIMKIKTQLTDLKNEGKISANAYQVANQQLAFYQPTEANFNNLNINLDNVAFDIDEQSKKVETALNEAESEIDMAYKVLKATLEDDFKNFIDESDIDLKSDAGEVAKMLQEAYIDALKKGQFDDVEKAYREYKDNLVKALKDIENAGIDMQDLAKNSPKAIEDLKALGLTMEQNSAIATIMGNSVALANQKISLSEGQLAAQTSNMTVLRQELNSVMGGYEQRATYLAEVLKQVNHGEALSAEQVNHLVGLYPQLNDMIETHNGVLSIKASAIENVMNWEEANTKSEIDQLKTTATAQLEQVKLFIQGKSAQVKAVDALQQANIKADNASIASAAAAAGAAMRASIIKKNAALDPLAQLDAREIESRAYGAERSTYNSMMAGAKAQAANLEGFIRMLDSLKSQNLTANTIKAVDPPKAPKAEKKGGGGADKQEKETENLVYITDEYKKVMRELNMQIAKNRELMEEYPSYSKDYQEGLKREIGLIGQKIKATENEYSSLEKQIAQRKLEKTGLIDLNKENAGGGGGGGGGTAYTVQRGDTLSGIAKKFNTNYQAIAKANNIANANKISIGQKLNIGGTGGGGTGGGGGAGTYTVQRGDNPWTIESKLGLPHGTIMNLNKGLNAKKLQIGQKLNVGGGGGGNPVDNAKNAQAKLEEELDKARDELEQLQAQRIALRKEANDLTMELIQSEVARLDREAGLLESDVSNLDYLSVKLDENSEAWRKNRQQRLEFINTQAQKQAESIDFLDNEIKSAENILNEKMSDAVYDMLNEQKIKYLEIQQQIYEESKAITESVINEIIDTYERDFGDLDRQINRLNNIASRIAEGDLDKYAIAQEEIMKVYRQQMILTNARLEQLQAEEEIVKAFPDLYKDWKDQVKELQDTQEDLNQTLWDTQKDLLDSHESAIDDTIDLFQTYYEKRQDMELDAIDEIINKEEELSDKRIENYDKDLKAFQENINKQLQALDKAEKDRIFEKDLGTKRQSAQEIMDTIGLVSLDTSAQGKQRLRQLQEQLKSVTDEISEMQTQRRLENRKEALQKELEARADETDKITKSEEDRLDKETKRLEEHAKEVERKWENLIENERLFAQMREDLLAGNIETMSGQIDTFVQIIADSSKEMGESLSQNLIDNFINARKELLELDKAMTDSQIDFNAQYGSNVNKVTTDMINDIPMANPLSNLKLSNLNNISTGQNPLANNQIVNLTVNIDTIQGGQDGADQFINAVTNGLARKGVTI